MTILLRQGLSRLAKIMSINHNPYQSPNTKLVTEDNILIVHDVNYASRGDRLLAAILDGVIIAILAGVIFFSLKDLKIIQSFFFNSNIVINTLITICLSIILYILVHGYFIYKSAQTLGKYFLGIQVVDFDGNPISGNHYLFKRLLPFLALENLPAAGGLIALINYLLIFRKDHNCLHDDLAKTRVVPIIDQYENIGLIDTEINEQELTEISSEPSQDFKGYTFADLISALAAINQELYPERALSLKKEINYRKKMKNFN